MFSLFSVCICRHSVIFTATRLISHSLTENVAVFPASVCCGIGTIVSVSRLADHYVRRKLLCELTNDEACDIITVDTTITAPLCCSATAWLVRNRATTGEKQTAFPFAPVEPFLRNWANLNNFVFLQYKYFFELHFNLVLSLLNIIYWYYVQLAAQFFQNGEHLPSTWVILWFSCLSNLIKFQPQFFSCL